MLLAWAAYRAIMANILVELDKMTGVRPVGIGETWKRIATKVVLEIAGGGENDVCGKVQLCAGLEAGIDGAVHAVRALCESNRGD